MEKQHITLSDSDRVYLKDLLSKGTMKVRKQKRIQGLLCLDQGMSYGQVSTLLSIHYVTLSAWAKAYQESKLSFLNEAPRSGRPVKFDGVERAKVTALACSQAPQGYGQWSLRLLADRLVSLELVEQISYSSVGTILKKTSFSLTESANGVSGS